MHRVKMVWFDFGGVLSPPIPELFEQYQAKTGLAPAVLQQAMMDVASTLNLPMLAPIENAVLREEDWGQRLEAALQARLPGLDLSRARLTQFGRQWFEGVQANQSMTGAARRLKAAGRKIGILTNNVVEWEPYWRAMVDLDGVVDMVIDSCKERCRKPDERIFAIACERSGIEPRFSLLIDDALENIDSAARLGWQTLHFLENDETLSLLEARTGICLRNIEVE